jgi:hypothetical protein
VVLFLQLQQDDPWQVRLLPRVAFGAHLSPADLPSSAVGKEEEEEGELQEDLPGVVVLHHFLGRWQQQELVSHRKALQILNPLIIWARWVALLTVLRVCVYVSGYDLV